MVQSEFSTWTEFQSYSCSKFEIQPMGDSHSSHLIHVVLQILDRRYIDNLSGIKYIAT